MLGFCFNPVSFYYCFDEHDTRVEAIVAEITNTPWKERHAYVLRTAPGAPMRFGLSKAFHVSPFLPMDMDYDWRFSVPADTLAVHMSNLRGGRRIFDATLMLRRREISGAEPCSDARAPACRLARRRRPDLLAGVAALGQARPCPRPSRQARTWRKSRDRHDPDRTLRTHHAAGPAGPNRPQGRARAAVPAHARTPAAARRPADPRVRRRRRHRILDHCRSTRRSMPTSRSADRSAPGNPTSRDAGAPTTSWARCA